MDDLNRYLALLVGDPPAGLLELRWRRPKGAMRSEFIEATKFARAASRIRELAPSAEVYVGCAPRTFRAGGLQAVSAVNWLWADFDTAEGLAALANFEPAPAVEIASGSANHRHVYWPLLEPLSGDEAGIAMRRLQARLGSDASATHAAQVLRPPETFNHKHDPPSTVTLERFEAHAVDIGELLADTPRVDGPARNGHELGPTLAASDDPLRRIAPARYVELLTGQRPNRLGKVRCPFHEDADPSLHVYESPERGFYCFGCRTGGDVYVLAGELWRLKRRGKEFVELRRRLHERLGIPEQTLTSVQGP